MLVKRSDVIVGSSRFSMPGAWADDTTNAHEPASDEDDAFEAEGAIAVATMPSTPALVLHDVTSGGSTTCSRTPSIASSCASDANDARSFVTAPEMHEAEWLEVPRRTRPRRLSAVERECKVFERHERWAAAGTVLLDPDAVAWIPCNLDNHQRKHRDDQGRENFEKYRHDAVRLHRAPVSGSQWGFVDRVDGHVYRYDVARELLSVAAPNGFILTAFTPRRFDRIFNYTAPDGAQARLRYDRNIVGLQACYLAALNHYNVTTLERAPRSIKQQSGPERTQLLERVLNSHGIAREGFLQGPQQR